jgi:hypothetical protein
MFLPFENISEDFIVENDGVFLNFGKGRSSVMILRGPRILYQIGIVFMVNPGCFKTKGLGPLAKGRPPKWRRMGL